MCVHLDYMHPEFAPFKPMASKLGLIYQAIDLIRSNFQCFLNL